MRDVVALTSRLIEFDTSNPPGREQPCAEFAASWLAEAGLRTSLIPLAPGRCNVIATLVGRDSSLPPLVFTGHLDTVPAGAAPWRFPPHAGRVAEGRVHGRGASDMKSGVAAMMCAAAAAAEAGVRRDVVLVLTCGEETGCEGARALLGSPEFSLREAVGVVVGEPTANRLATAHKGAFCVLARAKGVAAHSSTPEAGVNAIYAAARAVRAIENLCLEVRHDPILGGCTLNVGVFRGGENYNSVPDHAEFTIDARTNGLVSTATIERQLRSALGEGITLETIVDVPPVRTSADTDFVRAAMEVSGQPGRRPDDLSVTYFTDGAVLKERLDCPIIIMGPGEPGAAHQTDESCPLANIHEAVAIYGRLITRFG